MPLKTRLLLAACLLVLATRAMAVEPPSAKAPAKTYLMVVAHPDDENIIGGVLARLAREGHHVRLVIATDGKYSPLATSIPEGDALGAVRRDESRCAAKALGIPPPVFLSIDRLDTRNGVRRYLEGRKQLLELLAKELATTRPDVLLTFGPDGEYGHPEHIVASAALTELLLRDGLVEQYPLYHFAWRREQVLDDDSLAHVDPAYLGAVARFSDEDEEKSFAAARCYASQFTKEEMDAQVAGAAAADNVVYFRRFRADRIDAGHVRDEL
ncbi:PIG-L family deacetylase [Arenimonas sp.]|uniref:PIG-L family deacetylase n=1 Tax=Arenimonas sp. TaxID=1872635 RepID=UPI0025BE50BD|nr:PIG-L family deacetylase [Arenimonas sp.]